MASTSNPIVGELWRGDGVESIHRGAWVLVDTRGDVIDGRGDPHQLVYARSSTKSIQALPLIESGAADELGISDAGIAVAIASHNGEAIHVDAARHILELAGLTESHLRCGPQRPAGGAADEPAARITNNCSGKHAGFLATAVFMDDDPADYLSPTSAVQRAVHEAIIDLTRADPATVSTAIDGCSAPTYRLPLAALATGLARMANPGGLSPQRVAACERIVDAARKHPELVAGTAPARFDTVVLSTTNGRLFAKGGAEGVQTVGVVGAGVGFAAKIDDGARRSLEPLTVEVLFRAGHISDAEHEQLHAWHDPVRHNFDGIEIGRHVILS